MSAIKNLILDIEILYNQGFSVSDISKKLDIDFKMVNDTIHILNCESDYLLENNPAKY